MPDPVVNRERRREGNPPYGFGHRVMSERFDYLIVGDGRVADGAARGIRERDRQGRIGIVGGPTAPPVAGVATPTAAPPMAHLQTPATLRLETHVTRLDAEAQTVTTDAGEVLEYGTLLIATPDDPTVTDLPDDERVVCYQGVDDYRLVRELTRERPRVGVIGGGFLAIELAAMLAKSGRRVTLLYPEETLGGALFPPGLAMRFEDAFSSAGVALRSSTTVTGGTADAGGITLRTDDRRPVTVDVVVSAPGSEPAVRLAKDAGIDTHDGIVVDNRLCTRNPHIYAAGDVAEYPDVILGRRCIEHVDYATAMGIAVGRAMAEGGDAYTHTPYFSAQVFDIAYEATGVIDARLETVEDWTNPLNEGVIYYLKSGIVAGVLLWNVPGRLEAALRVLASARSLTRGDLPGLIGPERPDND